MKIENIKTTELIPYINNTRTHDHEQVVNIASSIKEFGFTNPILIDQKNGVIAGHGRLLAAIKLKLEEVPCIVLSNLSEIQRKAYAIADNKIAMNSGWDEDLLKLEFEFLKENDFDTDIIGFDLEELEELFNDDCSEGEGLTDPDEVPDAEDKSVNIQGDVWVLGNHRLMCSDSTNRESVEKLLNKNTIDLIFSDPPYGVNYSDKNTFLNKADKGNRIQKNIKNDELSLEDISVLWKNTFSLWKDYFSEYSSFYISSPQGSDLFMMMMMMMMNNGFPVKHVIIWNKNNHVLGRCDYNYKHEPIIYGWLNTHKFYGKGQFKNTVWDIPKPQKSDLHPTMKPVELIENCILNSSLKGHTMADMFGGSGSTLIACEKTHRHCFMMELDEHYCDVIIKRWQEYTGQQAIHEATGQTFGSIKQERV